jgi:hypothetical protein
MYYNSQRLNRRQNSNKVQELLAINNQNKTLKRIEILQLNSYDKYPGKTIFSY